MPPGPGEPGYSELDLADSICIACEEAGYRCDECPYWNLTPPSDTTTVCDGWGLDGLTGCEHMEEVCNRCLDLQFISCDTCPLGVKAAIIKSIQVLYDPVAVQAGDASVFKVSEVSKYYPRKGPPEWRIHQWTVLSDTVNALDSPLVYPTYSINLGYTDLIINFNNQDSILAMLEQDLQQEFATAGASAANQEQYAQSVVEALSHPLGKNMIDSPDLSPELGDCGGPCNPDLFAMRIYYDKKPPVLNPPAQFNGNISALVWGVHKHGWMGYGFKYDPFDRLKEATSALSLPTVDLDEGQYFDAKYSYDEDGNITRLHRWGITDTCVGGFGIQYDFEKLDDLTYVYDDTTNRLVNIQEAANVDGGYKSTGGNFSYDNAGNMTGDDGRDISALYNHLSLPYKLSGVGGNYKITYDALGNKLYADGPDGRIHYVRGLEFTNGALTSAMHEEGRVLQVESDSFLHEFVHRDHLGNVRVVFNDQYPDGLIKEHLGEIQQEHHYYPFGLEWGPVYGNPPSAGNSIPWYWQAGDDEHRFRYNGKEFHGHEINWLDYGARWYDPVIGRWGQVDPLADAAPAWTPYRYGFNNPILYTDPLGLFETRAEAKDHRKEEGIKGRIRKQDDGNFAIVHKGSDGNIKTYNDTEFGVVTEFTYVERGVHLRDIGLDGFNELTNPYSESYNPNALVFTDWADITYAFGAYLGFASPSARVVTASKSATTVATQTAKSPVGRSGNVLQEFTKGAARNTSTVINGRKYTGHALDQMQNRGIISPTAVDDVIRNPAQVIPGNTPGTSVYIRDNLKVVANTAGDVITVVWQ